MKNFIGKLVYKSIKTARFLKPRCIALPISLARAPASIAKEGKCRGWRLWTEKMLKISPVQVLLEAAAVWGEPYFARESLVSTALSCLEAKALATPGLGRSPTFK